MGRARQGWLRARQRMGQVGAFSVLCVGMQASRLSGHASGPTHCLGTSSALQGTGKWTIQQAAELSVAAPTMEAALDARFLSGVCACVLMGHANEALQQ